MPRKAATPRQSETAASNFARSDLRATGAAANSP
jgi:hypothetical protein